MHNESYEGMMIYDNVWKLLFGIDIAGLNLGLSGSQ